MYSDSLINDEPTSTSGGYTAAMPPATSARRRDHSRAPSATISATVTVPSSASNTRAAAQSRARIADAHELVHGRQREREQRRTEGGRPRN